MDQQSPSAANSPNDTASAFDIETRKARLEATVAAVRAERSRPRPTRGAFEDWGDLRDLLPRRTIPAPACSECHDRGYLNPDFARIDAEAGLPIPGSHWCECEAGKEARATFEVGRQAALRTRAERLHRYLDELFGSIPEKMRGYTWESYVQRGGKPGAVGLVWRFLQDGCLPDDAETRLGLVLWGQSGVGKSGLCALAVKEKLAAGVPALFVEFGALLDRLRWSYARKRRGRGDDEEVLMGEEERLVQAAETVPFLVLDDLGDVDRRSEQTDWTRSIAFQIVNVRHANNRPLLVTTNLSPEVMRDQFGERTWWRLREMSHVRELTGRNLRAL